MRYGSIVPILVVVTATACEDHAVAPARTPPGPPSGAATAAASSDVCPGCVFGPKTYTRSTGSPTTEVARFAGNPTTQYVVDIDDRGSEGQDGTVRLNGELLLGSRTNQDVGPRRVRRTVSLLNENTLTVRLTGKPGSYLVVYVTAAPSKLKVIEQPTLVKDAVPFVGVPVVEVQDAQGRRVHGAGNRVDVSVVYGNASASGETSAVADEGHARFDGLIANGAGPMLLWFQSPGLSPAVSDTIGVAGRAVAIDSTVLSLVPDSIAQANGAYTFTVLGAMPQIDSGQVVFGSQRGGFLRRVLSVTKGGSTLIVQTADASMEQLGLSGSYAGSADLRGILETLEATAGRAQPAKVDFSVTSALTLPNQSFQLSPCVSVQLRNLTVTPSFGTFTFGFSFSRWGTYQGVHASLPVTVVLSGQYVASVSCFSLGASLTVPVLPPQFKNLLRVPLPPVPLVPPFVLYHDLQFDLKLGLSLATSGIPPTLLSGDFSVSSATTVTLGHSSSTGLSFSVPTTTTATGSVSQANASSPNFSLTAPRLAASVQWRFWGVPGPYLSVGPYLRASWTDNPFFSRYELTCSSGISAEAAIDLKIYKLLRFTAAIPLFDVPSGPPFCQFFYPYGGTLAGTVSSPQLGSLSGITVSIAGLTAQSNTSGSYSIASVPAGTHAVSVSGLPSGCTNPGPSSATVSANTTTTVNFSVTCLTPQPISGFVGSWSGSISAQPFVIDVWFASGGVTAAGKFGGNPRERLRVLGTIPGVPESLLLYRGQDDASMRLSRNAAGQVTLEYWEGGCSRTAQQLKYSSLPNSTSSPVVVTPIAADFVGVWNGALGGTPFTLDVSQAAGQTSITANFGSGTEQLVPLGFAIGPPRTMLVFRPDTLTTLSIFQNSSGQTMLEFWTVGCAQSVIIQKQPPPATSSLIAHYAFEGNANDAGGNNLHGTVNSAVFVGGRIGSALQFSGGTSHVSVPIVSGSPLALRTNDQFTVAMWIRADQLPTTSSNAIPLVAGVQTFGWGLQLQSDGTPLANACTPNQFCRSAFGPTQSVVAGRWYHVAQVYDGVASTMRFYLNGVPAGITSVAFSQATTDRWLYIGGPPHATQFAFQGSVDDVRVYRGILTDQEIANLANVAASGPSALQFND